AGHAIATAGDRAVARVAGQAIDYQRQSGFSGLRADLAPDLFVPFHLGRVLQGSVTGGVRETAYHLTDAQQVAFAIPNGPHDSLLRSGFVSAPESALPELKTDHSRELGEVQGELGTGIER